MMDSLSIVLLAVLTGGLGGLFAAFDVLEQPQTADKMRKPGLWPRTYLGLLIGMVTGIVFVLGRFWLRGLI